MNPDRKKRDHAPESTELEFPPLAPPVGGPAERNKHWPVHPAIKGGGAPMPRVVGKTQVPEVELEDPQDD